MQRRQLLGRLGGIGGCLTGVDYADVLSDSGPPRTDGGEDVMPIDLRFVVVTDGHWGQTADRAPDWEAAHDDALTLINTLHNERALDFVVHDGDIVHDDETLHQEVIDNFFTELPVSEWYPVMGNHDFATDAEWQNIYGVPKQQTFEAGNYGCIITNTGVERSANTYESADPTFVENSIDGFSGKDGVFVFQHIAPFTDTDEYGVDSPDVREQFERGIVEAVFLGHHHNKNWIEERDGARYAYANRIGSHTLNADDYPEPVEFGLRVVDVYDSGTIEMRQLSVPDGTLLNDQAAGRPPEIEGDSMSVVLEPSAGMF